MNCFVMGEGLQFLILSLSPKRGITVLHTALWERGLPDQMRGTGTCCKFLARITGGRDAHFEIFYLLARHRAGAHVSTPGLNAARVWLGFFLELGIKSRASDMSDRPPATSQSSQMVLEEVTSLRRDDTGV